MLQDKFLPQFDFSEKHNTIIAGTPEKIFALVDELDLSKSLIIKILFRLRGLKTKISLKDGLLRQKFIALEEIKNRELIMGLIGQFWKPNGNLKKMNATEFLSFSEPGFLKATWNFELTAQADGKTMLETETRIRCLDEKAYKNFARYWFFIRPFSGLIRKEILRAVRRKAERA
jgi:hypothetical protein